MVNRPPFNNCGFGSPATAQVKFVLLVLRILLRNRRRTLHINTQEMLNLAHNCGFFVFFPRLTVKSGRITWTFRLWVLDKQLAIVYA